MKNKWCYDCYFNKQKPKGILKKIYYAIWFLANYPFSPSKIFQVYAGELSSAVIEGLEKGLKEE